jgi:apolipoprotein N-acyltransferase
MNYLYAGLAGLISSTAFAPLSFWPSAFIGLTVWYFLLIESNLRGRIYISYVFGLGILLPVQHWTGIYVGNLPWLILCFAQALIFTFPAFFVGKKLKSNQLAFACSFVAVELLLRTIPFTGFGWSRLSFTQVDGPLQYLYSSGGAVLVAFLIALISSSKSLINLAIISLVIAGLSFLPRIETTSGKSSVALVQGGVVKLGLDFNSKPREVFLRHLNQTSDSVKVGQVDLVIWPENAVDIDINTNDDVKKLISDKSAFLATPILVGGVTRSGENFLNQSSLFDSDIKQIYSKRYLTPFGEYLPLSAVANRISKFASNITDFKAGEQDTKFLIDGATFQTLICYELVNDSFRNQIDSNFLVIQTNNATFGNTAQLDQQLNIARVRAIETGRYISYVSTTGITSLIDNRGKVLKQLPKFEPATLFAEVNHVEDKTITQSFGKYLEYVAGAFLLLIFLNRKRGSRW